MANNLVGKLEAEFELKSDADEFFHSFGAKAHQLPDLVNEKVNRIEVHEGDWKTSFFFFIFSLSHWAQQSSRLMVDYELLIRLKIVAKVIVH